MVLQNIDPVGTTCPQASIHVAWSMFRAPLRHFGQEQRYSQAEQLLNVCSVGVEWPLNLQGESHTSDELLGKK